MDRSSPYQRRGGLLIEATKGPPMTLLMQPGTDRHDGERRALDGVGSLRAELTGGLPCDG